MFYKHYLQSNSPFTRRLATILMDSHYRGNGNEDVINRSDGRSKDIILFLDVNIETYCIESLEKWHIIGIK